MVKQIVPQNSSLNMYVYIYIHHGQKVFHESTIFHTKKSNKNSQVSCLATQILSEVYIPFLEKPSAPSFKSTFVFGDSWEVGMNCAGGCGSKFLDHQTISLYMWFEWSQLIANLYPKRFFRCHQPEDTLGSGGWEQWYHHISIINPGWLSMVGLRILRNISISLAFCISFYKSCKSCRKEQRTKYIMGK